MKHFFDFWSVPHFLSGVVSAMFTVVIGLPPLFMLCLTFAIAIVWELLEMRFRLREASLNVVSDVLLPLAAFIATLAFMQGFVPDADHRAGLLFVACILYVYTNVIAWQARFDHDTDFLS